MDSEQRIPLFILCILFILSKLFPCALRTLVGIA